MVEITFAALENIRIQLAADLLAEREKSFHAETEASDQRIRAEGAEFDLRQLRKAVDEWKAARVAYDADPVGGREQMKKAAEALRHA